MQHARVIMAMPKGSGNKSKGRRMVWVGVCLHTCVGVHTHTCTIESHPLAFLGKFPEGSPSHSKNTWILLEMLALCHGATRAAAVACAVRTHQSLGMTPSSQFFPCPDIPIPADYTRTGPRGGGLCISHFQEGRDCKEKALIKPQDPISLAHAANQLLFLLELYTALGKVFPQL